ncbi:hypothetical protein H6F78_25865 [Coleofasciculus sp. FACHB-64]|uniref:hypothetical protein n=1 Tax=Cyanophyceae TaxID=3028117 RepID=UPI00168698F3|nr:hypothetical protein [Coleofasciculus sp. FACHB-64]MBD2048984.1 hypothetical protein [Coleofasciculus sp. FACHB-64]
MNKMKLLRKIAASGTICLAFAGLAGQLAQAQQRTTFLFSSSCVPRVRIRSSLRDVSINREVFTEIFYIRDNSLISCRIRPAGSAPRYKTLRLAFGSDDTLQGYEPVEVKVYLDGNLAASRLISPSEKALLLLDVSKASSVAIEIPDNHDGYSTGVSLIQALLEPISSSPGSRR